MDIRHPLTELDWELIGLSQSADLQLHCLLTKADKIKSLKAHSTLANVNRDLQVEPNLLSCQLFSGSKGTGLDVLEQTMNRWMTDPVKP